MSQNIDDLRESVLVDDQDLTNDEARHVFAVLDAARERAAGLAKDLEAVKHLMRIADRQASALHSAAEAAHEVLADVLGVAYGS